MESSSSPELANMKEALQKMMGKINPAHNHKEMAQLVDKFKAMATAPNKSEGMRTAWTIHLQQSWSATDLATSSPAQDQKLEITIYRPGMIHPATFPVERSELEKGQFSFHLPSVILRAFTESAHELLECDLENYDNLMPESGRDAGGEDVSTFVDRINRECATNTPPGMLPNSIYGMYKKKKEGVLRGTIYRPTTLCVRDATFYSLLMNYVLLNDLVDYLTIMPHSETESGYAALPSPGSTVASAPKMRKDVTFCGFPLCKSLKIDHYRCSGCKIAYFCSKEHQVASWKADGGKLCKSIKKLEQREADQRKRGGLDFLDIGGMTLIS